MSLHACYLSFLILHSELKLLEDVLDCDIVSPVHEYLCEAISLPASIFENACAHNHPIESSLAQLFTSKSQCLSVLWVWCFLIDRVKDESFESLAQKPLVEHLVGSEAHLSLYLFDSHVHSEACKGLRYESLEHGSSRQALHASRVYWVVSQGSKRLSTDAIVPISVRNLLVQTIVTFRPSLSVKSWHDCLLPHEHWLF